MCRSNDSDCRHAHRDGWRAARCGSERINSCQAEHRSAQPLQRVAWSSQVRTSALARHSSLHAQAVTVCAASRKSRPARHSSRVASRALRPAARTFALGPGSRSAAPKPGRACGDVTWQRPKHRSRSAGRAVRSLGLEPRLFAHCVSHARDTVWALGGMSTCDRGRVAPQVLRSVPLSWSGPHAARHCRRAVMWPLPDGLQPVRSRRLCNRAVHGRERRGISAGLARE